MGTIRKLLFNPLFLLVLQSAIIIVFISRDESQRVTYWGDSFSYLQYSAEVYPEILELEKSFSGKLARKLIVPKTQQKFGSDAPRFTREKIAHMLANIRTPGYPAFLVTAHILSPDLKLLPVFQFCLLALAVIFFYTSMLCYGFRKFTAFCCSSILLYGTPTLCLTKTVMTDLPGTALAVFTVGFLLRCVVTPDRVLPVVLMSISMFITCLTRPVYLFLLPWLPATGFILEWMHSRYMGLKTDFFRLLSRAVLVAVIIAAPLVIYSSLRQAVVGHFGLCSFEGINFIGIAIQILNEDEVENLSEDLQTPALEMMQCLKEKASLLQVHGNRATPAQYDKLYKNYDIAVHHCAIPVAIKHVKRPGENLDLVAMNGLITKISHEIIRMKPRLYADIVWKNFTNAILETFTKRVFRKKGILIFLLGLMAGGSAVVATTVKNSTTKTYISKSARFELQTMFIVAVGFYLLKLTLVVLVEIPFIRYIQAAATFFPTLLYCAASVLWMDVFTKNRSSD